MEVGLSHPYYILGGLQTGGTILNLDELKRNDFRRVHFDNSSTTGAKPEGVTWGTLLTLKSVGDTYTQITFSNEGRLMFIRQYRDNKWFDWEKFPSGIPVYLKDYPTIADLATALGTNLSVVNSMGMSYHTKANNESVVYLIGNIKKTSYIPQNNYEVLLVSDVGQVARYFLGANQYYSTYVHAYKIFGDQQADVKFYRTAGDNGKYYMSIGTGNNAIRAFCNSSDFSSTTLPSDAIEITLS